MMNIADLRFTPGDFGSRIPGFILTFDDNGVGSVVKTAEGTSAAQAMGRRLKQERKRQGITQKDLAKTAGCAQQTVLDLEYGNVEFSRYLVDIAKVLGVSVHWLQSGEGRPDRPDTMAHPIGVVPWSYFDELAKKDTEAQITDWVGGCPVDHSADTVAVFADEAAAFAMQGTVVTGEWLFVDPRRDDAGLVVCIMAGWQRAELRDLANIGGRWFLRVTNQALPNQLVPVTVHTSRADFNAALQVPGQDTLPCLVLGKVIFRGVPG